MHVFTYSERLNTQAISLPGALPAKERARRSKLLHNLSEEKRKHFYEQNLGTKLPVLWEAAQSGGQMFGFTPNYIKVQASYDPLLVNTISEVHLGSLSFDKTTVVVGTTTNHLTFELNAASN